MRSPRTGDARSRSISRPAATRAARARSRAPARRPFAERASAPACRHRWRESGLAVRSAVADELHDSARVAATIKSLPLTLLRPRPIDEAISSAGGVRFDALDDGLMLKRLPGVFCAGEMIDWEAPTGGYLLTACFASGLVAGRAAAQRAKALARSPRQRAALALELTIRRRATDTTRYARGRVSSRMKADHRSPRSPAHRARQRHLALAECDPEAFADPVVADRQHVGPSEPEHQQHLHGPAADAAHFASSAR